MEIIDLTLSAPTSSPGHSSSSAPVARTMLSGVTRYAIIDLTDTTTEDDDKDVGPVIVPPIMDHYEDEYEDEAWSDDQEDDDEDDDVAVPAPAIARPRTGADFLFETDDDDDDEALWGLSKRDQLLPVHAFKTSNDPVQDACPICLSPYEDGDMLRTLTCHHHFHRFCIDEWYVYKGVGHCGS